MRRYDSNFDKKILTVLARKKKGPTNGNMKLI